jgi:hypothetical protein
MINILTAFYFLLNVIILSSVNNNFKTIHEFGMDGKDYLFNAQDICLIGGKKLMISDNAGFRLVVCDTAFNSITYIGKKGNKIGEFRQEPNKLAANERYIIVSDFSSSRLQVFNEELKPINDFYTEGPVFALAFDKNGSLLVGTLTAKGKTLLYRYKYPFDKYDVIELKNLKGDLFTDIYEINVLPNGKFVIAYPTQNKLELHDAYGKYLNTIVISDLQAQPNFLYENNLKLPDGIILQSLSSDASSNIWVLAGSYSIEPKREIFIYTDGGKLLKKTMLPEQADKLLVEGDFLYTIESKRTTLKKYFINFRLK